MLEDDQQEEEVDGEVQDFTVTLQRFQDEDSG